MSKAILGAIVMTGMGVTLGATLALVPGHASACGGFFCNGGGGTGPTPVVQAAERVIFEKRPDGTVRTYVQIRYDQQNGAPIGFSWIIPVTAVPEVGIADVATFDELDQATNPQFRFINNGVPASSSGGGGIGCGASMDASARGSAETPVMDVEGVTVWETSRVGDYDTATISGDRAEDLLEWLRINGYDIPTEATAIVGEYVAEGHLFVAFKYAPIMPGSGTLDPIVLTYPGDKPCVPIRITAIASAPVLDVMVLAFGDRRAAPDGAYMSTEPDYDAVRPDFSMGNGTTYAVEVLRAIDAAGGNAFVTEAAMPTAQLTGLNDVEAMALAGRSAYVTRFYTRFTPETMTVDPEFVFPGGADVARMHVIDITPRTASAAGASSPLRYAAGPGVLLTAALVLAYRRSRRR